MDPARLLCVQVVAKITHHFGSAPFSIRVWQLFTPLSPNLNIAGDLAVVRRVPGAKITHHPRPLVNRAATLCINIKMRGFGGGDWILGLVIVIAGHARWCVILALTRCETTGCLIKYDDDDGDDYGDEY